MTLTAEMNVRGFTIQLDTIGRWDDDPMIRVDSAEQTRIADNVRRALESQGQTIELL